MKENIETICTLLKKAAEQDYIGEQVSQLEHALQAAYFASQDSPNKPELIIASLLHDIGHLVIDERTEYMDDLGVRYHEDTGALFLKKLGFKEEVCDLVESHVAAKRYLVSKHDSYRERLSDASRQTLEHQGGFMSKEEVLEFERRSNFKDALKVRHFDDAAKKLDFAVPDLEAYIPLLEQMSQ